MPSLFTMEKAQIRFVWVLEMLGFLACIARILAMKLYYCKICVQLEILNIKLIVMYQAFS